MKVHTTLFGGAGNALENRKLLNFWARFIISLANAITFLVLLYLLFYSEVKESSRDLVNILCGAYVAVLAKSTDYWFREKKDHEHEEEMDRVKNGANTKV
jgi:heme/copper-type cytochrome/quinol oxidase subunit 4